MSNININLKLKKNFITITLLKDIFKGCKQIFIELHFIKLKFYLQRNFIHDELQHAISLDQFK